jgi:hypothetical protein
MGSLVSWCYQQQKFILSYIYYELYVVGHLSNQNASCPGCWLLYTASSLGKNMCSMVCTEVPNQIKFVSRPHPTGSRTDFTYVYRLCVQTRLDFNFNWISLISYLKYPFERFFMQCVAIGAFCKYPFCMVPCGLGCIGS